MTPIYWNAIISALIQLESGGDPEAVNGDAVGCLQLTPAFVEDAMRILTLKKKQRLSGRKAEHLKQTQIVTGTPPMHYNLVDRYDREKSFQMARVVLGYYARKLGNVTPRDIAGIFRGGYAGYKAAPDKHSDYLDRFENLYKEEIK